MSRIGRREDQCPCGGEHRWEWYGTLTHICEKCLGLTYGMDCPDGRGFSDAVYAPGDVERRRAGWERIKERRALREAR